MRKSMHQAPEMEINVFEGLKKKKKKTLSKGDGEKQIWKHPKEGLEMR